MAKKTEKSQGLVRRSARSSNRVMRAYDKRAIQDVEIGGAKKIQNRLKVSKKARVVRARRIRGKSRKVTNRQEPADVEPGRSRALSPIAVVSHDGKFVALERALARGKLWDIIEAVRRRTRLAKRKFEILIKPDLDAFELVGSTATDPDLVEHLIDLLHDRGYVRTSVCEGRDGMAQWLENRDVQVRADLIGYKFVTPKGREYDVIDLCEDLVPGPFTRSEMLYGTGLPRVWQNGNFRIIFAKNKTDDSSGYYLCLNNLLSILPLRDKEYHYRYRLDRTNVLLELVPRAHVDFCIVDAFISNHGSAGSRVARPRETRTIIAGRDLLLTDHVASLKMGVAPDVSAVHVAAQEKFGLSQPYRVVGNLAPYEDWINVHPLVLDSTRRREAWPELSQILQPWLQRVDQERFPFKDPVNEKINRVLGQYFSSIDDNTVALGSIVVLNYALALLHEGITALQITYWKDALKRYEVPLNLQPRDFRDEDFDSVAPYIEAIESQIEKLVPDQNRLRWTYDKHGAVLFEFSRVIPVPFDVFVRRVDVAKTIQYMTDYIGGVILHVKTNSRGRVTQQIERNLYLPQPNYLALYQGKNIDVSKLELIRYGRTEHKMFWKTIKSENDSATFDDGSVRFARVNGGDTFVSICGRQKFSLPLFWEIINLDNYPLLKHMLVTHAYTTFFTQTMANLEAVYEGREVRIGKSWDPRAGEPDSLSADGSPSARIAQLLNNAQDFLRRNILDREGLVSRLLTPFNPVPNFVDEIGFAHFKPSGPSTGRRTEQPAGDKIGAAVIASATYGALRRIFDDFCFALRKDLGLQCD
jgi:uncharacterized protein (DUF362 family)